MCRCKCPPSCRNRVVQKGRSAKLAIYRSRGLRELLPLSFCLNFSLLEGLKLQERNNANIVIKFWLNCHSQFSLFTQPEVEFKRLKLIPWVYPGRPVERSPGIWILILTLLEKPFPDLTPLFSIYVPSLYQYS